MCIIFALPPQLLKFQSHRASGWRRIFVSRLWSINLPLCNKCQLKYILKISRYRQRRPSHSFWQRLVRILYSYIFLSNHEHCRIYQLWTIDANVHRDGQWKLHPKFYKFDYDLKSLKKHLQTNNQFK